MASPYYRSHYQPSRTFYQGVYQPHQTFYQPHLSFSQHFRSPYQPSFYQPNYYQPVYNPIASAPVQSVPTVRIVEANAVSPAGAAAALAYVNTVGAEDLCGRAAKAYLESVVAGGDSVADGTVFLVILSWIALTWHALLKTTFLTKYMKRKYVLFLS